MQHFSLYQSCLSGSAEGQPVIVAFLKATDKVRIIEQISPISTFSADIKVNRVSYYNKRFQVELPELPPSSE